MTTLSTTPSSCSETARLDEEGDEMGKRAYIPWHDRIDEELVKDITRQFVQEVYRRAGMRITKVSVHWSHDGKDFDAHAEGTPLAKPPS